MGWGGWWERCGEMEAGWDYWRGIYDTDVSYNHAPFFSRLSLARDLRSVMIITTHIIHSLTV